MWQSDEVQGGARCASIKILFLEEQIIITIDVSSEIRTWHHPNTRGRVISLPENTTKQSLYSAYVTSTLEYDPGLLWCSVRAVFTIFCFMQLERIMTEIS